ncbi:MAG: cysteine desulfurase family protein [Bdellovibrionales bacterium]
MNTETTDLYPAQFSANSKQIYFDHNATTPLSGLVRERLLEFADAWGNPSSIHQSGRGPKKLIRDARRQVADLIGVHPMEVVFTSCGSESNTMMMKGMFEKLISNGQSRPRFLISTVEHPATMKAIEELMDRGLEVDWISVSRKGCISMEKYEQQLKQGVHFVSCMIANNETGNIFPVKEMARRAHEVGAKFHCDAVQGLGKLELDLNSLGVDYATVSAHKFYSLKGCAVLFVKKGDNNLPSLVNGGGQERGRRGGTENVISIAALGEVAKVKNNIKSQIERVEKLRNYMEKEILEKISDVIVNGDSCPRVCNTSSLIIKDADGESLLMNLDIAGFAVSTGAACSSGNPEPSPVLLNMGLSREEAQSSLRVSLGWGNTLEEVDQFISALVQIVVRLRKIKKEGAYE